MKKSKLIILLIILLTICGCSKTKKKNHEVKKDDTFVNYLKNYDEDYRYIDNYTTVKCSALKDNDLMMLARDYFITSDGVVYRINIYSGQLFSNDEQCMKADINTTMKKVVNNTIVGNDGKMYRYDVIENKLIINEYYDTNSNENILVQNNDVINYSYQNNDGSEYADSPSENIYYSKFFVLKTDGNIYSIIIKQSTEYNYDILDYNPAKYEIVSEKIAYSKDEYGHIIDFSSNEKDEVDRIVTTDKIYLLKEIETKECKKYIDIACEKKLVEIEAYKKYFKEVKYTNSEFILLKDNTIIPLDILAYVK